MRITENMMAQAYLDGLNRNMEQIAEYQEQLSTNKRINRPSDDPVGVINSLTVRSNLSRLSQYSRNIDDASSWLTQSETALTDLNSSLVSVYELALQAGGGSMSKTDKLAIATEVKQIRDYMIELGNTRVGDKYVFGGFNTKTAPFTQAGGSVLYQGVDLSLASPAQVAAFQNQETAFDTGKGTRIKVSLTGVDLTGAGDDNFFKTIDDMIQALEADSTSDDLADFAEKMLQAQERVLSTLADVGGRQNRLERLSERYAVDQFNYESLQSSIEDIDTAEIITRMKLAETVYESALSIGSRVIMPNLTQFLS